MNNLRVVKITEKNRAMYEEQIVALEKIATYPLGKDFFQIDHGKDYFRFFERLGRMFYHAAVVDGRVVAVGCGIIRYVPFDFSGRVKKCWYLCDLKVHPEFRRNRIPLNMLYSAFFPNYFRSMRGYTISMNPSEGENRVVKILCRFKWIPISYQRELEIYSLSYQELQNTREVIEKHRGPISFLSHTGVKDIVLQSTQKPMPLLHVQFGKCAENGCVAQPEHVHMFCSPKDDSLSLEVKSLGLNPSATASIIGHRIKSDWKFILTSDV
ncbi:GNAT family N-acetyltransferase [Candidatus Uabimicrobium sp. HlEnr_7]|uniref:GNAT family N-acetyltransferase n=1 Tax=Candidatus Uabimicrobium helgolandensis TaxID=3095367 RepID=UPI0035584E6B